MPKADEPPEEELHEIGRRLCALIRIKPREPLSAARLRRIVVECRDVVPFERRGVLLALRACADGFAALELPPEVRSLRDVLEKYQDSLTDEAELRQRVVDCAEGAIPRLDESAEDNEEVLEMARTDDDRAAGRAYLLWPSADSLRTCPRALVQALRHEQEAVFWLRKILYDLTLTNSDRRIVAHFGPTKTRIAKALHDEGGYRVPQIATITEPFRQKGASRRQALNTVRRRLKSKTEDHLHPVNPVAPDDPHARQKMDVLKALADFVAGVGHDVTVVDRSPHESATGPESSDEG